MRAADATPNGTTRERATLSDRRAGLWRWLVLAPAVIGLALCGTGAVLVTPTSDGGLPAYLCVIVGGWALAFAVVNALSGFSERWQWAGHVALAAVAIAVATATAPLIRLLATLPDPWGRSLAVVALGIPPAVGWVLITLLGRISGRVDRAAATRAAALAEPVWRGTDARPEVTVSASRFTVRGVTTLVAGAIVVAAASTILLVIVAERWVLRLPPLMLVVVLGALIGMPLYAAVWLVVNRRRRLVTLRWSAGALEVDAGASWTVPLAMIQRLVWRTSGDLARLEIHTATRSETFLVGMVRQHTRTAAELPTLQWRMQRGLEEAGLYPHERRGTLRYDRRVRTADDANRGVSARAAPPARG